ncbi:MAG: DUF6807 family protein [Planctomycetaceae bacterium]
MILGALGGSVGVPAENAASFAGPFALERTDDGVRVTEEGRPVLFYQRRPKSAEGRYERANYVHPLYDLAGEELTEDFPPDHLHQRGIYWAWHQLWIGQRRVGDPWAAQRFLAEVRSIEVKSQDDDALALEARVQWTSPLVTGVDGSRIPIVEERTIVRAHRRGEHHRAIDFEIRLRALLPGVRIGGSEDDKGYGGFSARIKLPVDVKFAGPRGPIAPQLTAVDAGPWVDISTKNGGMAILSHPSNPGHPQPWVLRAQKSMQNPAWPGREAAAIPQDDDLTLRYRIVVHDGVGRDALDRLHAEYAK